LKQPKVPRILSLRVQVLNFVPKAAKLINVGKRCGDVKAGVSTLAIFFHHGNQRKTVEDHHMS
jgi:hypothetical protein